MHNDWRGCDPMANRWGRCRSDPGGRWRAAMPIRLSGRWSLHVGVCCVPIRWGSRPGRSAGRDRGRTITRARTGTAAQAATPPRAVRLGPGCGRLVREAAGGPRAIPQSSGELHAKASKAAAGAIRDVAGLLAETRQANAETVGPERERLIPVLFQPLADAISKAAPSDLAAHCEAWREIAVGFARGAE